MKVLVACEFTGTVREAFAAKGHDAWSCDIRPTERPGKHLQCDVRGILNDGWDLMIAHPPCEKLSYAGMRWFKVQPNRMNEAKAAFAFFMELINAPIPMIAVENPKGFTLKWYHRPDQIVEPYHFGHPVTKATGLWLKQLPPFMATLIIIDPFVNWTTYQGSHNGKARSRTFQGIADAMAAQWH